MFAHFDEFACKRPGLLRCRLCLRWVPLRPIGGLLYERLGLALKELDIIDLSIKLTHILADQGSAFSFLSMFSMAVVQ